jgi:selenocysteine lyase/cysteine desulfurase
LGVDFLAAGCLKFLMGPAGIAFLYVRPELIEALHPSATGWFGRADPFAFQVRQLDWSPTASRFDGGTPPVINAYIARAGMEIINQIGPDAVGAAHRRLGTRLIEGGRARGLALHGPGDSDRKTVSTAFVVPDSAAVETALRRCGVLASARGPVIRLAPHFYTTDREVDQALDALAEILRT